MAMIAMNTIDMRHQATTQANPVATWTPAASRRHLLFFLDWLSAHPYLMTFQREHDLLEFELRPGGKIQGLRRLGPSVELVTGQWTCILAQKGVRFDMQFDGGRRATLWVEAKGDVLAGTLALFEADESGSNLTPTSWAH